MIKTNEVTLDKALSIAQKYHQSGNLTLADKTYRDILKTYPDNFKSLHYLGIIAYQRNDLNDGIHFLKQATDTDDSNHETWNAYAVMLEITKNIDAAIKAWEKSLELKPDYPDALSNYGNALWKLENFQKAEELCGKALKLDPDFFPALINLGNAFFAQGKKDKAVTQWKKTLKLNPDNHNAHINIGNALRDLGKIKEAEEHCRKALEVAPQNPDALLNLANTLADQGLYEEAKDLYRQATNEKPDYAQAHSNSAANFINLMRLDEALVSTRYAIAFDPNHAEAYGHMAVILRELGRFAEAETAARKSLLLSPDSAAARIDLAETLFLLDNYDEAVTLFNSAMELEPDSPRLYIKLSAALDRANKPDEALAALDKAVELNPEMPEAYHLKAATHHTNNETDKALKALKKALEIHPNFPEAIALHSEIMQSHGKMKEAKELITKAIEINDKIPSLYLTLSKVKKFTANDPVLKTMKELIKKTDVFGRMHAPPLHYSLFKAYEDIGDYDNAFKHLKQGADIRRSNAVFDPNNHKNFLENIKKAYSQENLKAYKGKGFEDNTPIFIVGMPRSGTTLTEQIISSHPDVYGAGELYLLSNIEKEVGTLTTETAKEWGEEYVKRVRALTPQSNAAVKITDKMPGNYVRMGQIVAALPNAKIIHCRRNPIDTCLSCYKQLFARGHYWSYNLDEMVQHYEEYNNMMEFWRETMPDRFLEIDYEDTINDFENQARKLISYVDMEWDNACLTPHKSKRSVLTASKGQVIKPIYNTSIHAWKRYEGQLEPLASKLEKYVRK